MKKLLNTGIILFCLMTARAEEAGFQLALFPEFALHSMDTSIHGLSLNFLGQNEQHGLTFGIGNWMTGGSYGFTLGCVNKTESYHGVQWGVMNYDSENASGWMLGAINAVGGTFTGFQLGGFNYAKTCSGFQLGAFNYADELSGLQIGAINIVTKNTWFQDWPNQLGAFFPIVNWSF
jgi:hypothetical protein